VPQQVPVQDVPASTNHLFNINNLGWDQLGRILRDQPQVPAHLLIVIETGAPPDEGVMDWGAAKLAHLERNADLFRARLSA
jgi:hypothetical protein